MSRSSTSFRLLVVALSLGWLMSEFNQGTDILDYLILIRSLVFDRDLFLGNDMAVVGSQVFVTHTGYPLNIANLGITLFWLPFYLVALALAKLLALTKLLPPEATSVTGFDFVILIWLKLADWCYGVLALRLTFLAARQVVAERPARLATLWVAVGSPFLYYMGAITPSTHMVSVFLSALFLYGFLRARETLADDHAWVGLGVVGGLALLVANTNVGLVALPFLYFLTTRPSRRWLGQGLRFALCYVLAFAPQLLVWSLFMGSPLRSPYAGYATTFELHLGEIFFSSYHGLYFYAPLLLLATGGLCLLVRRDRPLALGGLLLVLLTAYLSSVNIAWWAGGAFGARYLLGATPVFVLGLGHLLERVQQGGKRRLLVALVALCILWTFLLYLPYATRTASLMTYYPVSELVGLLVRALATVQAWDGTELAGGAARVLFALPLAYMLARLMERQCHAPRRAADRLFARPTIALLPLLLVVIMGAVVARSDASRARCERAGCNQGWIRSDIDLQELAYNYVERARYYAKRGKWQAAIADMERAVAAYPADPLLHQLLGELRGSAP